MHSYIIEANSAAELRAKVFEMAKVLGAQEEITSSATVKLPKKISKQQPEKEEKDVISASSLKAEGKKAKSKTSEPEKVSAPVDPFETSEVVDNKKLTLEDAKAALTAVKNEKGMEAVKEVLAVFDVKMLSAIPTEEYGTFIEECQKKIKE